MMGFLSIEKPDAFVVHVTGYSSALKGLKAREIRAAAQTEAAFVTCSVREIEHDIRLFET